MSLLVNTKINYIVWWFNCCYFLQHKTYKFQCLTFASPSAPIDTSLTPLEAIKSKALFTLAILWNLILPLSGLGNCSPEITSNNNMSFSPLRKSSSMFSIPVPAFLKWELHHAVKVCKTNYTNKKHVINKTKLCSIIIKLR